VPCPPSPPSHRWGTLSRRERGKGGSVVAGLNFFQLRSKFAPAPTSRGVLATRRRPSFCAPPPRHRKILSSRERPQGGGAPKGASIHCPRGAIGCRHLKALRARKRAIRGALAFRRSDRGACQSDRTLQLSPGRASRERQGAGVTAPPIALKRSTPRPGRSAGGDDAGTATARVTRPARRNRTCSASGIVSRSAPRMSKISPSVT
jgi:hypothetical protein